MKHHTGHLIFFMLLLLVSGCVSSQLSRVDVEEAIPLQGWDNVNNLFQDDHFYFSGQPDSAAFHRLAGEAGIRTVVSFRRPQELEQLDFDEPALVEKLGMRFVNIPVMPNSFSKDDVDRLASVLDETKGPVLLHCGSSNRVGGVWATYLVQHRGLELEEALRLGQSAGLKSDSMVDAFKRVAGEQP